MCLFPIRIKNKRYTKTKKNGGIIPPLLSQTALGIDVPCGQCIECRKQIARGWQIRLTEEIKIHKKAHFVTYSFSEESLDKLSEDAKSQNAKEIATLAVKRWRENFRAKYGRSPKHWLVTEIGKNNTERLHLHGIIFDELDGTDKWIYGNTFVGDEVSQRSVNYIVKYITKEDMQHKKFQPTVLCSPGIGKDFLKPENIAYMRKHDHYKGPNGQKLPIPTYWKRKIMTDEEREILWVKKAEEPIRWIRGQKFNISTKKGFQEYRNALKRAQIKNKEMGYGYRSKKNTAKAKKDWEKFE